MSSKHMCMIAIYQLALPQLLIGEYEHAVGEYECVVGDYEHVLCE